MTATRITADEIKHLALLCRIAMSDDETDAMREQMANILDNIDVLNQVDASGVAPAAHSVDLTSVMREDEARGSIPTADALANAPVRDGDFIRVKAVLE